jgi:predicted metal-dependent peptidase
MSEQGKEERRLSKAVITLMRQPRFAFYSGMLMMGRTSVEDEGVPTAYTDGRNRKFGREFIRGLKDKELAFVALHECMHDLYMHLTVWLKLYKENPKLANMACDYVINLELVLLDPKEDFIAMPRDKSGKAMGCLDMRFKGMNSKQVFDILKDEGGHDTGEDGEEGFDEHGWEEAQDRSKEEKEEIAKEVERAIRQGLVALKKAGKGAGDISLELAELIEPKVDWREVLREFVKATCRAPQVSSWRKVNRRFLAGGGGSSDSYMPSMIGETVGRLVIGVDTSGSIGGEELVAFLSEVKSIAEDVNPEKIDLVYWDTRVAGHEEYEQSNMADLVKSTKPVGGGGTSPSCVTDWLHKTKIVPECSIILTDGCVGGDWGGDWPSPVLWCIVGPYGKSIMAGTGKTVHVN